VTISLLEVALDQPDAQRPHTARAVCGVREAVTALADIWQGAAVARVVPSAASTLSIVSTSAADAAAGTGARAVRIVGLDASGAEITEDVTLNGLTPAVSVKLYLRVNDVVTITAGSGGVNAGDIVVTHTGAAGVIAFAAAGEGRALMAAYSVPTGRRALVLAFRAQGDDTAASPEITLYERTGIVGTVPSLRAITKLRVASRASVIDYRAYPYVEGPCDLVVKASSGSSARISAQLDVLLANT
jgi:hypothetical protein